MGLTLACELLRRRVRIRIIDALTIPSSQAKAVVIHARTLELLDKLGLVDDFLQAGRRVLAVNMYAEARHLARFDFASLDTPYPFLLDLPQRQTEKILLGHLEGRGVVVERDAVLDQLSQDANGIEVGIRRNGRIETLRASWLAGCDGAESRVRELLGIGFEGGAAGETWWVADSRIQWKLPADETHIFLGEEGIAAFFPLENGGWRIICRTGNENTIPSAEAMRTAIEAVGAGSLEIESLNPVTSFYVPHRRAVKVNEGRAFLLGDAAHVHTPVGGQGMNTGMQDAFNLGWKLGLVVRRTLSPSVLESFAVERGSVTSRVLRDTAALDKVLSVTGSTARGLRNAAVTLLSGVDALRLAVLRKLSETEITYPNSSISAEDWHGGGGLPLGSRFPDMMLKRLPAKDDIRIFDIMRGGEFEIMVFSGQKMGEANVLSIARIAREEFSGFARTHIISAFELPGLPPEWAKQAYLDPDSVVHKLLGVDKAAIYVIRPDGYISYKSKPADLEKLTAYFNQRLLAVSA